ncbi:MAG: DEAD/DEAH box helicase [Planctomycetota bacterium]
MRDRALEYLRVALAQPDAQFREGQWESIEALLSGRRLLVVQRTGWGKSMVYFLATRLLRDSGAGVSLLISPLLALVRNQLEAAARIGVRAESINSTNMPEWRLIEQGLRKHAIDILLISPERLANDKFRENVLSHVAEHVGLFIVDEAYGILLHGEEDERITDFFIRSAFPPQRHVEVILETLDNADEGLSVRELEARLNLRHGQIEKALKYLSVESPSPVTKIGPKWNVTAVAETYRINQEYVESISAIRRHEQAQMAQYLEHGGCLMEYLERALDDPAARPCGGVRKNSKSLPSILLRRSFRRY